ncbi:lysophospholipid acyltransferase family protein [Guyparkeria halophila]|uniref:Lysophospholipid acyltransferase family protein n=1 Tax=Guyparkeria halophila TaxID=47960 RepID=A0ABZ0YVT0_9GAMM|nr:lysophospholipid acyltransferase family protein [Guyparkeria halophila]WQH15322.1 lysophospholipid acyltransferase family protein [Guyparkeria halophila]
MSTGLGSLARALHRVIAVPLGHGGLAVLLIGWLPLALMVALLPGPTRRLAARRIIHHAMRAYRLWLVTIGALRVDSRPLDTLKRAPAGVIVANHPSLLDALIVLAHAPNIICVMRAGLLRNPLFALPARLAGYLPNDHALDMMLGARAAIRSGCHVLMFPEGSRSPGDDAAGLGPFQPAPFMLARQAGAPLHAFVFRYDRPLLTKQTPAWQLPKLPVRLRVERLAVHPDLLESNPHRAATAWRNRFATELDAR